MIKKNIFLLISLISCVFCQISFGKVLYKKGEELSQQQIQVLSFGSGTLKESQEFSSPCLRLESNNYHSGGEILLPLPVDIKDLWNNRKLLLMFDFIQGGKGLTINKKDSLSPLSRSRFDMKVCLLQSNHQGGEICFSVEPGASRVGFPLHMVKGLSLTQPLTGLKISTSSEECLYFTRIYFDEDITPIQGKFLPCVNEVGLGEEVKFQAEGFGGATPIQYNWTINPKSILAIDHIDAQWSYRFLKPGTYYIRLMISDIAGLKKSYITSRKIVVNP